jgi:DNA primase
MNLKEIIDNIKEKITPAHIITILDEMGGEPQYQNSNIIVSKTICHNGDSRKLYYYLNSNMFHCYTNCGSFDVIELVRKFYHLNLIQAIYKLINDLNLEDIINFNDITEDNDDIRKLEKEYYEQHKNLVREIKKQDIQLKEFDDNILKYFMYPIIGPWEREGIGREVIKQAKIGYYPGGGQITIPHYDKNNRLIGLRGRQLGQEEAEIFGKYRPLFINNLSYAHPLGFNLYNLNNSKDNIAKVQKAIVFEAEKSTLLYRTFFGEENDISVACCGSSLTDYQVQLLLGAGAREIIIAFDRQFQEIEDEEFNKLINKLIKLDKKYRKLVNISFIFDKKMITAYKASPIDEGPTKFLKLFKERVIL